MKITRNVNGVRTTVDHQDDGSVVETDCQCFGNPERCHSSEACPLFKRQMEGANQDNQDHVARQLQCNQA